VRKLRVVTLVDRPTVTGGAERLAVQVASRLDRERFESVLCASRGTDEPLLDAELAAAGVEVLNLNRGSKLDLRAWRPLVRRLGTRVYNGLLRTVCQYRGTDTHGLKAFRREALVGTAERCIVDKDLFASEFVVRAGREGKKVIEIPLRVHEKRKPSINLTKRVPNVLKNLAKLTYVIRFKKS